MKRPWTEQELDVLRQRYSSASGDEIAQQLGRSASAVYQAARSLGLRKEVRIGPKRKLVGELGQQAIADYIAGMPNRELEKKYGVSKSLITKRVRQFDATKVKGKGQRTTDLTEEQEHEIVQLYQTGVSQDRIAKTVGISQGAVSLALKRQGARKGHQSGALSPQWKGGRIMNRDGYVRIWLDESDPLYVMADTTSYALEHRLVMARHLGRPLERHESIHHINGDRTDNRLENLQLRNGKHGPGVVHRCRECGSTNIESTKLH